MITQPKAYGGPTSQIVITTQDVYVYFIQGKTFIFLTSTSVQNVILPSPVGRPFGPGGPYFNLFNNNSSISAFNVVTSGLGSICTVDPGEMAEIFMTDPDENEWIYKIGTFV